MAEQRLEEGPDYLINRIPQGSYDPSKGTGQRKIRWSFAAPEDYGYIDLLTSGDSNGTMPGRNCAGDNEDIDTIINNKGAAGCNLPGSTLYGGYDEFYQTIKGKAFETPPMCYLDFAHGYNVMDYINGLRDNLPMRGREQFEYSLQRNVIESAQYNTSVVSGFTTAAGSFPAVPTGALDLGTVRRMFRLLRRNGWAGTPEIGPISYEAFETMRNNYKKFEGVELQSSLDSDETRHIPFGTQAVNWGGIRWILSDVTMRGYLVPQSDGTNKFVPVHPTKTRAGTGGGVVPEINPDFDNCFTVCEGVRYELYEVGFAVDPSAANRNALAESQIPGLTGNKFNFDVRMLTGNDIECNVDDLKFAFRMLHAYSFELLWPERMGAILYRVSPDCVNSVAPCCDVECAPAPGNEVGIKHPDGPVSNSCFEDDCNPAACDDIPKNTVAPLPTQDNNCPTPDEGVIRLSTCGPIITETDSGTVCVWVERAGGSIGAAAVDYATGDGTGVDPTDYLDVSGTLNWADGENDRKKVCVPIVSTGAGNTAFTFTISGVVGAELADGATTGCASVSIQIEAPCAYAP